MNWSTYPRMELEVAECDPALSIPTEIYDNAGNVIGPIPAQEYSLLRQEREGKKQLLGKLTCHCRDHGGEVLSIISTMFDPGNEAETNSAQTSFMQYIARAIQKHYWP